MASVPADLGRFQEQLSAWARAVLAEDAEVSEPFPMPGNAGLSFGFDVRTGGGLMAYVIRLAPPGVRRQGNTDVLRQVPLLSVLARSAVPVAPVRWSTDDPRWFGTDAVVQDRLPARPLHLTDAGLSCDPATSDVIPYVDQAVDALGAIHSVPWERELVGWQPPRPLAEEIEFWDRILGQSDIASWRNEGTELRDALVATLPPEVAVGLCHGDYQPNNVLYGGDRRLVAVVDWELSGVGAQLLDVAWFSMFTDPTCWHSSHAGLLRVRVDPGVVAERYVRATGRHVADLGWFRGLACFRFAVITTLNVRLHRTGRRVDESWENYARSVSTLFDRGIAAVGV